MQPRIWTELDCSRLRANLKEIRRHAGRGVQVMAVVKADAYGHGALPVARGLMEAACGGPERFAVATPDEALRLRRAGIDRPIQVLGPQLESELHTSLAAGAVITVHSRAEVDALARLARYNVRPVSVHVHLDTGMGRMGCSPRDLPDIVDAVRACPYLKLEGLSSHYAEAEVAGSAATRRQTRVLLSLNAAETLRRRGAKVRYVHIGNTAGLVLHANQGFNLVRPGLGLLGLAPSPDVAARLNVQPALSWKTRVVLVRTLSRGSTIGYGMTHRLEQPTRIATLPVGYADGFRRSLSNNADVLIRGQRARVIGRVSMDLVTVNVNHIPEVQPGDEVVLLGRQGNQEIRAEDLASRAGIAIYELFCGLGPRVERFVIRDPAAVLPDAAPFRTLRKSA